MSSDHPARFALCGAGMIARVHGAAALAIGGTVSAIASRDPRRAIALTETLGGQAVLYDELPAGADIVIVCTPPAQHLEHAQHAASEGASVVIEKPLCTTLADADQFVALAASARLLYAENLRHAPVIEDLLAELPTLGPLQHVEARSMQGLPAWGDFTSTEWGGGALFDLGAHPLALVLTAARLSGAGPAVSVRAEMRGGAGHQTDEHADVLIRFESGLTAHVIASWQAGPSPVWDFQASSATGVLRADIFPTPSLHRDGEPRPISSPVVEGPLGDLGYATQLARFAAHDPDVPLPGVELGRQVLDVTCGAYASAARGGDAVDLPYSGRRDATPLDILRGR